MSLFSLSFSMSVSPSPVFRLSMPVTSCRAGWGQASNRSAFVGSSSFIDPKPGRQYGPDRIPVVYYTDWDDLVFPHLQVGRMNLQGRRRVLDYPVRYFSFFLRVVTQNKKKSRRWTWHRWDCLVLSSHAGILLLLLSIPPLSLSLFAFGSAWSILREASTRRLLQRWILLPPGVH